MSVTTGAIRTNNPANNSEPQAPPRLGLGSLYPPYGMRSRAQTQGSSTGFRRLRTEWKRAFASGLFGQCLLTMEHYGQAETYLLRAYDASAKTFGTTRALTGPRAAALVDLYAKTDRPREADRYRLPPEASEDSSADAQPAARSATNSNP